MDLTPVVDRPTQIVHKVPDHDCEALLDPSFSMPISVHEAILRLDSLKLILSYI